jgi:hypothetical protein
LPIPAFCLWRKTARLWWSTTTRSATFTAATVSRNGGCVRRYVSLGGQTYSRIAEHQANGRKIETGVTGDFARPRFSVIFVHGRGGDQRLGMNDYTFGGNFNRLKNLMVAQWRRLSGADSAQFRQCRVRDTSRH